MTINAFDYAGLRVVLSHSFIMQEPVQVLSPEVLVSDEFRTDFNRWLREFFGVKEAAYQIGDTLFVGPGTYEKLRKELQERADAMPRGVWS